MEFRIHQKESGNIAELISDKVYYKVEDFIDLLGNANYLGAEKMIIPAANLHPDFFDLKTKLAGEVLQKFSTYRQKLAIVGDFSKYTSKSLRDFIRESNRMKQILFVDHLTNAIEML